MYAQKLCTVWLNVIALAFAAGYDENSETTIKPGRYVPELHGGHRGRYTQDDSGKYRHIHKPYDGGYGDRGEPYYNDFPGYYQNNGENIAFEMPKTSGLSLGPKDHLRFMVDFNYNGTGWQIVKFEWISDNETMPRYKYINKNRLWTDGKTVKEAYEYEQPDTYEDQGDIDPTRYEHAESEEEDKNEENSHVHVDGAYDQEMQKYRVKYSNEDGSNHVPKDPSVIRGTIAEVLEYIQQNIVPTLS